MALNPPLKNRPALAAWRRGFWDQRKGAEPHFFGGTARWMQPYYHAGWYEAENTPGAYVEACFNERHLVKMALSFSLHNAHVSTGPDKRALIEALVPGWQRILKNMQKEPDK